MARLFVALVLWLGIAVLGAAIPGSAAPIAAAADAQWSCDPEPGDEDGRWIAAYHTAAAGASSGRLSSPPGTARICVSGDEQGIPRRTVAPSPLARPPFHLVDIPLLI